MVRLPRALAFQFNRPAHRGTPTRRQPGCPRPVCQQSVSQAAPPNPRPPLAILVYLNARKARSRSMVASSIARQLRPNSRPRYKRPHNCHRMATRTPTPPMTSPSHIQMFIAKVVGVRFSASQSARTLAACSSASGRPGQGAPPSVCEGGLLVFVRHQRMKSVNSLP